MFTFIVIASRQQEWFTHPAPFNVCSADGTARPLSFSGKLGTQLSIDNHQKHWEVFVVHLSVMLWFGVIAVWLFYEYLINQEVSINERISWEVIEDVKIDKILVLICWFRSFRLYSTVLVSIYLLSYQAYSYTLWYLKHSNQTQLSVCLR